MIQRWAFRCFLLFQRTFMTTSRSSDQLRSISEYISAYINCQVHKVTMHHTIWFLTEKIEKQLKYLKVENYYINYDNQFNEKHRQLCSYIV